jgi:hypothetical protein
MTGNYTDVNSLSSVIAASCLRRRWCCKSIKTAYSLGRETRTTYTNNVPSTRKNPFNRNSCPWNGAEIMSEMGQIWKLRYTSNSPLQGVASAEVFTGEAKIFCKFIDNLGYSMIAGGEINLLRTTKLRAGDAAWRCDGGVGLTE